MPDNHLASPRITVFDVVMPTSISGPPETRVSGWGMRRQRKISTLAQSESGRSMSRNRSLSQVSRIFCGDRTMVPKTDHVGVFAVQGLQVAVVAQTRGGDVEVFTVEGP